MFNETYNTTELYNEMQEIKNLLTKLNEYSYNRKRQLDELIWSQVFHDTIIGSDWLLDKSFNPGRFAVGYSALYVLYRILNDVKPQNILELGIGQSTRIIAQYAKASGANHIAVDHNKPWLDFFKETFPLPPTTQLMLFELTKKSSNGEDIFAYTDDFATEMSGKKFDLIFIDAPYGSVKEVPVRLDTLPLLPDCLNESFVIMLDDYNRPGEKATIELIRDKLTQAKIKHMFTSYNGMKDIAIIVSDDLQFLLSL